MELKIGNTPMIKIKYKYKGEENYIYTKLEFYNITGSIKDRVAYYIIKKAYENGDLQKGQRIVEATSGNTGISLAAMGAYFGNPVNIFMPDWVSKERVNLMKMYNAEVTLPKFASASAIINNISALLIRGNSGYVFPIGAPLASP